MSRRIVGPLLILLVTGGLSEIALTQAVHPIKGAPQRAMALADLNTLSSAILQFRLDCDRYPTAQEGLKALRLCQPGLDKKWRGPYISRGIPNDPWGHAYSYKWPGRKGPRSFTVISRGPNHGQPPITLEEPLSTK